MGHTLIHQRGVERGHRAAHLDTLVIVGDDPGYPLQETGYLTRHHGHDLLQLLGTRYLVFPLGDR